mmetsp:Transcript_40182/g.97067  ORF Transcript_40182/g.97067 Transcript_40182/m.97067 type:complete len:661 (-) Transcript_40182:143-2125(-)
MAAPPGNPSPSNKTVDPQQQPHDTVDGPSAAAAAAPEITLKDPPPAVAVAAAAASSPVPAAGLKDPPPGSASTAASASASAASGSGSAATTSSATKSNVPTYESSETSDNYMMAKAFLNAGEFEEAMIRLEDEMENVKSTLTEIIASASTSSTFMNESLGEATAPPNNIDIDKLCELHSSLAPLNYLYGTTLLYSIEESKDDNLQGGGGGGSAAAGAGAGGSNEAAGFTVAGSMAEQAIAAAQAAQDAEAGLAAAPAPPAAPAFPGSSDPSTAAGAGAAAEEDVDDMVIAWENLDVARAILERIITSNSDVNDQSKMDKYRLDLAQTLLRVADLQRLNGRYEACIQDYKSCLELRQKVFSDDPWNRKIADAQYNLGLSYLASSSELIKENTTTAEGGEVAAASGGASTAKTVADPVALSKEHCRQGIQMYLDCARTFSGILAQFCGADPNEAVLKSTEDELQVAATAAQQPTGGLKTTGLVDDDEAAKNPNKVASEASLQLSIWRSRIAKLLQTQAPTDEGTAAQAYDLQELLDEIQETIDEAEHSHEGVKQASQIKARAQAAVAAAAGGDDGPETTETTDADGVTTSIGFGSAAAASSAFASASTTTAATSAAAATAQPVMMVVKKKKKRTMDESEDGKQAAVPSSATEDAKRAKTTEE